MTACTHVLPRVAAFCALLGPIVFVSCTDGGVVDTGRTDAISPVDTGDGTAPPADGTTTPEDVPKADGGTDAPGDGGTPKDDGTPPGDVVPIDTGGPQPGQFLWPCDDSSDCYSEYCVPSPDGDVCSKTCSNDCPDGWACRQIATPGDPVYICIAQDVHLCRPCREDSECNQQGLTDDGICLPVPNAGSFCTRGCSDGDPCRAGFECLGLKPYGEQGPLLDLCSPLDPELDCACRAKFVEQGASSDCTNENPAGRCDGELICLEVGVYPSCNAQVPALETCNGLDDDCDGETDEDAQDCTWYYHDLDGDTYGAVTGECHCKAPGPNWLERGGDCFEGATSINPGAAETCFPIGVDDDCDGETDEEGSTGCTTYFLDNDSDDYGLDGVTACLCGPTEGWASEGGDCQDLEPLVNPGADEACDGLDNNCDGATDEKDAVGCKPYFLDNDGDGFGETSKVKCYCGPTGAHIAILPGDCLDTNAMVNPNAPEICNGIDDNCNMSVDEGEPQDMCPQVAHGLAGCVNGTCNLIDCEDGWSNADGDPLNGCECASGALEVPGAAGNSCQAPKEMGTLNDTGQEVEVTDNIVPIGDEDWFRFTALDGADPGGCDSFKVRVRFLHNPQDQFAFDVFKGGCQGSAEICKLVSEFTDSTNFFDPGAADNVEDQKGECPCTNDVDTSDGVQRCTDQTSTYLVRVYRRPGLADSCAAYTLTVSNGK